MQKKIFPLGKKMKLDCLFGGGVLVFNIAATISYFIKKNIGLAVTGIILSLFFLFLIIVTILSKIVFEEKEIYIAKIFFLFAKRNEYRAFKLKDRKMKTSIKIEYNKIKSVQFLKKDNPENDGIDIFARKKDIILFTDIDGRSYLMQADFFKPNQIQFIIDETKRRANIL